MSTVQKGNKVKVLYTGTLEDGTVFDRSTEEKPLEFTMGEGKLIKGFEAGIEGMSLGEQKSIGIAAAEAYGVWDKGLMRRVGRQFLAGNLDPRVGMVVKLHLPNGGTLPAAIVEVSETELVVDLNHPLAGKDLTFDVKVIGIE
ncbi:MAG: FKBP-type peptidyl-prolyl cis-trans isomerase [Endomicrobiales bacterium]